MKQHDIGTIVRIASGCGEDEEEAAQKWHDEHIANVFGERYRIHFTPHFSSVKDSDGNVKGDYKFFNKPFGLRHWMANTNINDNDIVVLIDPDMIILTQLNGDFSSQRDVIVGNRKQEKFKVEHGSPFGQTYGFGAQWSTKIDLAKVAGEDSPSVGISRQNAFKYYPVGPPYLATARDMRNIAEKWSEFVPEVHKQYPYLLAEVRDFVWKDAFITEACILNVCSLELPPGKMFAYCVAAAHLKLAHQRVDHLMVSNVGAGGEGWPFVDEIIKDESTNVCEFATFPVSSKLHALPAVIHYCQRYMLEGELFSKRRFNTNFYSCDTPSLTVYDNDFGGDQKTELKGKRNAFMLCAITSMLNASLDHFKNNHCSR